LPRNSGKYLTDYTAPFEARTTYSRDISEAVATGM